MNLKIGVFLLLLNLVQGKKKYSNKIHTDFSVLFSKHGIYLINNKDQASLVYFKIS